MAPAWSGEESTNEKLGEECLAGSMGDMGRVCQGRK